MVGVVLSYSGRPAGGETVGEGGGVRYREERGEENMMMRWRSAFGRGFFFPGILTRKEIKAGRDGLYTSLPLPKHP